MHSNRVDKRRAALRTREFAPLAWFADPRNFRLRAFDSRKDRNLSGVYWLVDRTHSMTPLRLRQRLIHLRSYCQGAGYASARAEASKMRFNAKNTTIFI